MKIKVVGSGIMGSWTAYELLQRGHQVKLFETHYPGHSKSSSGGESRLIRGIYGKDDIYMDWVAQSMKLWQTLQEKINRKLFYPIGTLWMFGDDTEYGDYSYQYLKNIGWDIHPMSIATAQTKYPQINFEDIRKIYHEPGSGYLMARLSCQLLKQRIIELGGSYEQQHVSIDEDRILEGSNTNKDFDYTIFACGPWLKKMFKHTLGEHLKISRQEIYYFSSPKADSDYHTPNMPTWIDLSEENHYGIPFTDQRGFKMADDTRRPAEVDLDVDHLDRTPQEHSIQNMKKYLVHRFPKFKQPALSEARVCQYTNTADGNFILDFAPGNNKVLIAGGGSGHAFKLGPSIGYHLADLIEQKSKPINMFSLARLKTNQTFKSQFKRNSSFY